MSWTQSSSASVRAARRTSSSERPRTVFDSSHAARAGRVDDSGGAINCASAVALRGFLRLSATGTWRAAVRSSALVPPCAAHAPVWHPRRLAAPEQPRQLPPSEESRQMPVNTQAVGKTYEPTVYAVGQGEDQGVRARGGRDQPRASRRARRPAPPATPTWSRRRCSRSSTRSPGRGPADIRPGARDQLRDDGPRRPGVRVGPARSWRATRSRPPRASRTSPNARVSATTCSSRSPPISAASRSVAGHGRRSFEECDRDGRSDSRASRFPR